MNILDKRFYNLINNLNSKSLDIIFNEILNKFKSLPQNIQESLENYFLKFPYWGKLSLKDKKLEEIMNRADTLKNHLSDFIWLYEHLEDYRSRYLLLAILNNWYQYDFNMLDNIKERVYPDYFDLDLVPYSKDSVLLDLGAYNGDSTLSYLFCYGENSYKKIYCYEITPSVFKTLQNNVQKYPNIECILKGASNKKEKLYIEENCEGASANRISAKGKIKVETTTIDDDIKDKITHIKMDIEGYEQKALKGCFNHIKNDHPYLLLSVYHNYEDIYKIPKLIKSINKDYKFYLRYHGGKLFPTEVTLIAVPS